MFFEQWAIRNEKQEKSRSCSPSTKMEEVRAAAAVKKRKPRLLARLGLLLISYSHAVSLICCFSGFIAILLLPILAKNTHVSENALLPGSANPTLSNQDVKEGDHLLKELLQWISKSDSSRREVPKLLAKFMSEAGVDVYYHEFEPPENQFHPLHFFSRTSYGGVNKDFNGNSSAPGVNVVGIVRAPRGDGKESIVLVTPYNSREFGATDALSAALVYSVFYLLSQVSWLAKDVIWVAADSSYGEHASVSAWLKDYYDPVFSISSRSYSPLSKEWSTVEGGSKKEFKRAGSMAAAFVFKIVESSKGYGKDGVSISAEASNGQMPNLDLINTAQYLAVHRHGFHVTIQMIHSLLPSFFLKTVGRLFEWLSETAGAINPPWRFGIPASDYLEGAATLASSLYLQALGVPTGPHGAFRDYQVDAITLEISPRMSLFNEMSRTAFLLRMGRFIEGIVRAINNLLEKFHHSYFLYLMTSASKFISVSVYMIPLALLVAPLPILAAALYMGKFLDNSTTATKATQAKEKQVKESNSSDDGIESFHSTWQWLHAARVACLVYIWAVLVSLMPYAITKLPGISGNSDLRLSIWIGLSSFFGCLFWASHFALSFKRAGGIKPKADDWAVLKAVTLGATTTGLGLMSIINFATAQFGAFFLVPLCLLICPLKRLNKKVSLRSAIMIAANVMLIMATFPPVIFFLVKLSSPASGYICFSDFWDWSELLWSWNSATYLYMLLIHLPSWTLCLIILFHR